MASHHDAFPTPSGFVGLLGFLDLGNHQLKGLGDILVDSGAGLYPATLQLLTQLLTFLGGDLSGLSSVDIALVADNHNWDRLGTLCKKSVWVVLSMDKWWNVQDD